MLKINKGVVGGADRGGVKNWLLIMEWKEMV